MLTEIQKLRQQADVAETQLLLEVMKLKNHMNECDCHVTGRVRDKYSFLNQVGIEPNLYCLNCGGFIKPRTGE